MVDPTDVLAWVESCHTYSHRLDFKSSKSSRDEYSQAFEQFYNIIGGPRYNLPASLTAMAPCFSSHLDIHKHQVVT